MGMAARAAAKRHYEDRLVEAIECLDCGSPRGQRCRYRGCEVIMCCQAREDFGQPILAAQVRFDLMLKSIGIWS